MKLIKHRLNEMIDFGIPIASSELSNDDKARIMSLILKEWLKHNPVTKQFPGLELLSLEWVWLDFRKKTLPQRIIYIMKKYKAIMTPAFYGSLGNHIRETIPASSQYYFDFTNVFDWTSGQYGDKRSCFLNGGSRTGVLKDMKRNGNFYAMRFYGLDPFANSNGMIDLMNMVPKYTVDNKKYYGRARIWLYYHEIKIRIHNSIVIEPVYFMFNSYGKESLREMAAVFSAYVGASFDTVKLSNLGKKCGGLYVNSGSMVIGNMNTITNIKEFDFNLETSYDKKDVGYQRNRYIELGTIRERWEAREYATIKRNRYHKRKGFKKSNATRMKRRSQNEIWLSLYYWLYDITSEWFYIDKWHKGKVFTHLLNPSKVRGSWKLLKYRYNNNFYQILIKLLQININGGFNDTSIKSKNSGKPKDEYSQPTLRRDEEDMQAELCRPREHTIDDPLYVEDGQEILV